MIKYRTKNDITFDSIDYVYDNYSILKDSNDGSTSTIFKYEPGKLLKIMDIPIIDFRYHTMNFINKLNTKVSAKIHNYIYIDGDRIGYIVDEMLGRNLLRIPVNTDVRKFIKSMKDVEKDIKIFSNNHILTDDLKPANIMYDIDTNKSSIIDTDLYLRLKDESKELITISNLNMLYISILQSIISPVRGAIDEEFYDYLLEIIIDNYDYTLPIDKFYEYILSEIESYYDKKMNTVGDIRKVLRLG